MVLLAAVSPGAALAGELRVSTEVLPCADAAGIATEIRRGAALPMSRQPDLALLLRGEAGDQLTVRLEAPHAALQRRIPFRSSDCAALAGAALLLLRDWLARDWSPPEVAPRVEPEPGTVALAAAPGGSDPVAPGGSDPVAPARPEPSWTLLALVGGFLSPNEAGYGPEAALGASYRLASRLALAFDAGYQGPVAADIGGGRVSVDLLRGGLTLGIMLYRAEDSRLEVATGPALALLRVRSQGYPISLSRDLAELAWTAALRWTLAVHRRLAAVATLRVDVRSRSDVVKVVGAEPDLRLAPVRLVLGGGLAWEVP